MLPESLQGEGKTQKKSVILAKAMGLEPMMTTDFLLRWTYEGAVKHGEPVTWNDNGFGDSIACPPTSDDLPNLYAPANMVLAWQCLNWVDTQNIHLDTVKGERSMRVELYYDVFHSMGAFDLPPAQAQAAWLDKVLELVIEAGLVEVER